MQVINTLKIQATVCATLPLAMENLVVLVRYSRLIFLLECSLSVGREFDGRRLMKEERYIIATPPEQLNSSYSSSLEI